MFDYLKKLFPPEVTPNDWSAERVRADARITELEAANVGLLRQISEREEIDERVRLQLGMYWLLVNQPAKLEQ